MADKQENKTNPIMKIVKSFQSGRVFSSKSAIIKPKKKKTSLKIIKTPLTSLKKKRKIIKVSAMPPIEVLNAAVNRKRAAEKQRRKFSKFLNLAYKNASKKEKNDNVLKRLYDIHHEYEAKHKLEIAGNIKAKIPAFALKAKVADFMRKAKSNSSGSKSLGNHDVVNENNLIKANKAQQEERNNRLTNEALEKLKIKGLYHSGSVNHKSMFEKTRIAGKELSDSLTPKPARTKDATIKRTPVKIRVLAEQHTR